MADVWNTWNMNTTGTWSAATYQMTSTITIRAFYHLRRRLGRFRVIHREVRRDHTGVYMLWLVEDADKNLHRVNFRLWSEAKP